MNYTFTFQDPLAARLELSGGKGSNLAILTQRGFPVPPGFILTAEAYRDFIAGGRELLRDRQPTAISRRGIAAGRKRKTPRGSRPAFAAGGGRGGSSGINSAAFQNIRRFPSDLLRPWKTWRAPPLPVNTKLISTVPARSRFWKRSRPASFPCGSTARLPTGINKDSITRWPPWLSSCSRWCNVKSPASASASIRSAAISTRWWWTPTSAWANRWSAARVKWITSPLTDPRAPFVRRISRGKAGRSLALPAAHRKFA